MGRVGGGGVGGMGVISSLPGLNAAPLCNPKHIHAKLCPSASSHAFIHPCLTGGSGPGAITGHLASMWFPAWALHVQETKW